jgi:hypothetical protein
MDEAARLRRRADPRKSIGRYCEMLHRTRMEFVYRTKERLPSSGIEMGQEGMCQLVVMVVDDNY